VIETITGGGDEDISILDGMKTSFPKDPRPTAIYRLVPIHGDKIYRV